MLYPTNSSQPVNSATDHSSTASKHTEPQTISMFSNKLRNQSSDIQRSGSFIVFLDVNDMVTKAKKWPRKKYLDEPICLTITLVILN